MKVKKLHSGFSLPELGLGTWPMGGFRHHDSRNDDERDIAAIKYAIDNGMTHFDTAELYGTGAAERILGKAIKGYDREKLQIASKVKGSNSGYEAIKIACRKSLERLGIDYLDLYYIHWREKQFDLQQQMKAMDELVEEGLIKNIGVSNFSVESFKEAQKYAKNKIVANQVHYNLYYRECEVEKDGEDPLLKYCQENDVLLVAYSPLDLGKLANFAGYSAVAVGEKLSKTQSQVALNFLSSQLNVVSVFKSSDPKHIEENLGSIGWKLDDSYCESLKVWSQKTRYVSDIVPLG